MPDNLSPEITKRKLDFAFWSAGANWEKWRRDFDYQGAHRNIPVLRCPDRFLKFVSEYHLFQRQTKEARLHARCAIVNCQLGLALRYGNGTGVEALARHLQVSGGTANVEISLLSKLAAFCRPAVFNAFDKTAEIGLKKFVFEPVHGGRLTYSAYCSNINSALEGELGTEIESYLLKQTLPTQKILGFKRRMLDFYLMIEGGRWDALI